MNINEHLVLVAMEECAEIQQALSKALRFGFDDYRPSTPDETNEDQILTEYYQLTAMIEELQHKNILKSLTEVEVMEIKSKKINKVYKYAEYSKQRKLLE
ncbi:hypothetical protein [Enterococcus sp. LJL51]|uniref:hypothetical protein n=1 Tax=Enterococcus sp. LJL51 TaxID=3416656 RepID=UPI003CE6AD6A